MDSKPPITGLGLSNSYDNVSLDPLKKPLETTQKTKPIAVSADSVQNPSTYFKTYATKQVSPETNRFLYALLHKNDEKLQEILQKEKIDFNERSCTGMTALHLAVQENNIEGVKIILKNNACINSVLATNKTPLYLAAERGLTDMVQLLLDNGANPYIKSYDNFTPLQIAEKRGDQSIVELFRVAIAGNPSAKNILTNSL